MIGTVTIHGRLFGNGRPFDKLDLRAAEPRLKADSIANETVTGAFIQAALAPGSLALAGLPSGGGSSSGPAPPAAVSGGNRFEALR